MFGLGKKKADDGNALSQPIPLGWEITDLGLLGSGGMSRVYRVRDETLGREIAFKVLRPELAKEPQALDRFVEEARITAQLDHPNVPPVYALASDRKKTTCFTLKVLEGKTLQDVLDARRHEGTEALFDALEVLVRVCDAVAFAHSKGIIHCDLKPLNVIVGEFGQIYLVDWGLARRKADLPKKGQHGNEAVGTPVYMAPEQARGENHALDERTDVFQLGGMLYRILAARPPYVAQTAEEVIELAKVGRYPSPETVAPKGRMVPRSLISICTKALSVDPAQRYQTAADFRRDVEDFIHGTARLPERHFAAGEAIVREGETGDCAYIIIDGHCQANRVVGGKNQMLRLMGPGEMFGEAAVLTNSPRLATVVALMDTTVAVVDRTFLEEEMERSSLMSLAIRTVAASFLDLNAQTAALIQEQTHVKAVEIALHDLALNGRVESDGVRSVPWQALMKLINAKTAMTDEQIARRIGRRADFEIDVAQDRLRLKPAP